MPELQIPDFQKTDGAKQIVISNGYLGCFEDDEEVLPFILMFFEEENGKMITEFTEYFDSIENLSERRKKLIAEIESNN